jgi:hypothetical protein
MIWLVLWIAVTIYGLVGLSLVLRHGLRALWELWPPGPEPIDALERRPTGRPSSREHRANLGDEVGRVDLPVRRIVLIERTHR